MTRVLQHKLPTTSAIVHPVDSKLRQEFENVGLSRHCMTICNDLGIENYDDLHYVSMRMLEKYQTKPVHREKLKALLRTYARCKDRVVSEGTGSEGAGGLSSTVGNESTVVVAACELGVGEGAGLGSAAVGNQSAVGAAVLELGVGEGAGLGSAAVGNQSTGEGEGGVSSAVGNQSTGEGAGGVSSAVGNQSAVQAAALELGVGEGGGAGSSVVRNQSDAWAVVCELGVDEGAGGASSAVRNQSAVQAAALELGVGEGGGAGSSVVRNQSDAWAVVCELAEGQGAGVLVSGEGNQTHNAAAALDVVVRGGEGVLSFAEGNQCARENAASNLAVGGEAGVFSSGVRYHSADAAAALPLAVKTYVHRSNKECHKCGNHGYSMSIDDAVKFFLSKGRKDLRKFYREVFLYIAKSTLRTDQINSMPYEDIKNEVEKETRAFILRLCKEDVIAMREQGYDVSCLIECRQCKQNGASRYMCDRARRGMNGEIFSQRENGFGVECNVRGQFWALMEKWNKKV